MINTKTKLDKKEKVKRVCDCVAWVQVVTSYAMSGEMTYKKARKKK